MTTLPSGISLHRADSLDEIPSRTLYSIARLRQEIFVVEQNCVYLDLDGRDLDPGSIQIWAATPDGTIASSLRILNEDALEPGLRSIGRVVTDPAWRGRGIAAAVLRSAIEACSGQQILIHAQSHLTEWYARFGFVTSGPEFLEDDIPHTPMRLSGGG